MRHRSPTGERAPESAPEPAPGRRIRPAAAVARTTSTPAKSQPIPADAPATAAAATADAPQPEATVDAAQGRGEGARREHGREPHGTDRDERAHDPGEADDRQPHRHQQPPQARARRQGLVHPPHRLGDGAGAQGVPEPERVLRRGRRQAVGRHARPHQPRHRDRPPQARRHPHPRGSRHQALPTESGPPARAPAPGTPNPPNVRAPPASAPTANVSDAATDVRRRRAYPCGASVSTIEKPHGDHAPVRPAASAAASRQAVARHRALEVHDADPLPVVVAVGLQRAVPVDPPAGAPRSSRRLRTFRGSSGTRRRRCGPGARTGAGGLATRRAGRRRQQSALEVGQRDASLVHRARRRRRSGGPRSSTRLPSRARSGSPWRSIRGSPVGCGRPSVV